MKAYHIVEWKRLYELTDKGRPAPEDHPFEELRKTPIPYIRYSDNGLLLSPSWLKLMKNAWTIGPMMDVACYGLYWKLVDIARDKPKQFRGWILDDKNLPLNAWQVVEILGMGDSEHIKPLFDLLCSPAINKLELLDVPADFPIPPDSARQRENAGTFQDVTETEVEVKFKRNERVSQLDPLAKYDSPPPEESLSQAPPSDRVSVRDSGDTVTASDSVPTGGPGREKGAAAAKQLFVLELTTLIHWRNQSDRTTLLDIAEQLEHRVVYETEDNLFAEALEKARGCTKVGRNPLAMFVSAMKKSPFHYIPKGTSYIRGAKDKYHV